MLNPSSYLAIINPILGGDLLDILIPHAGNTGLELLRVTDVCEWALDVLTLLVLKGKNLCGGERGEQFLKLTDLDMLIWSHCSRFKGISHVFQDEINFPVIKK
jgi:hypothetical protein